MPPLSLFCQNSGILKLPYSSVYPIYDTLTTAFSEIHAWHKTSGYFLLSALLVSLILGLCILLNLRCPQAVSDDALTQEQLTRGVTLTGWQQTGPGHWRFAFEAPADVPELVLCLSTRLLDAVPEGLEPTDQRGEAFWVRPVPGRTSEITVTSTTVPQMWLMLPDTLWHWRELRSSLQLMALVAFASMGAGILALFCFKPQHELGVFLLYLGVMFGWGLAVLLPAGQTGALLGFLMGLYFPFAVLTPLWLCCSLLHVALPRRGSRRFALSVLGVLLFLVLGTSTQAVLRNVTLLAGMAMVLVVLARALAKKERPAWYLLAGYILTFGLRLTVVLPSFRFWFYRESFPFYMVRCARLYDIPFTLGCLVFVSHRYALQFDRTEQLAQELEARVAQRTQALQNETDARKSMMLNIFHDLRSPLFVIGSGLDTLAAAPDALPTLLPVLQERVGFVRRLTEDLFLAAKLEQKQVLLNEDRARLEALTAAVCSACQAEAAHKGVELRTDTGTPLPVWGDAVRLEQILQNLVTNAIHYTPSGGRVTVVCAAENGQACVKVTDTGCGIAPEDQPAVFDRYFHTTADTKHDSTGLGLTIAQELAHLHRGEIMLQSEPGKGSCFTLCLPLLDAE